MAHGGQPPGGTRQQQDEQQEAPILALASMLFQEHKHFSAPPHAHYPDSRQHDDSSEASESSEPAAAMTSQGGTAPLLPSVHELLSATYTSSSSRASASPLAATQAYTSPRPLPHPVSHMRSASASPVPQEERKARRTHPNATAARSVSPPQPRTCNVCRKRIASYKKVRSAEVILWGKPTVVEAVCPSCTSKLINLELAHLGNPSVAKPPIAAQHPEGCPLPPQFKACHWCATTDTPKWTSGPEGPQTLCNACGVQYDRGRTLEEARARVKRPRGRWSPSPS